MADPVTVGLGLSAGKSLAEGIAGRNAAKAEQERANINAYIGRTRAIQTDTTSRQGLEDELGSMRAVMGANQQRPGVGTLEMLTELREARGRERRINVGNRNTEAADWRMAGRNAGKQARAAMTLGLIKAGPSLFDMYDLKSKG